MGSKTGDHYPEELQDKRIRVASSGRPAAGSRVYNLLDAFGISTRADGRFDQGMQNGDVVNFIPPSGAQMICLF